MRRIRVYVAGPISTLPSGEKAGYYEIMDNIRRALLAGKELIKLGFAPMLPQLDIIMNMFNKLTYEEMCSCDFAWIEVCDVMLVIGISNGVREEIRLAHSKDIPIVYSIEELVTWRTYHGQEL